MTQSTRPRVGLIRFLGSNCDQDCIDAFSRNHGIDLELIWHTETTLPKLDGLILPGGFSFGDFLRSGALASHTKIMGAVKAFADRGGAILGICNGFQILTEAGVLPGALIRNASCKFVCETSELVLGSGESHYHKTLAGQNYRIPVAHGEGRFHIDADGLKRLQDNGQILFRYDINPNGAVDNIAGIVSGNGKVLGMMPHPERASFQDFGDQGDGIAITTAFLETCL